MTAVSNNSQCQRMKQTVPAQLAQVHASGDRHLIAYGCLCASSRPAMMGKIAITRSCCSSSSSSTSQHTTIALKNATLASFSPEYTRITHSNVALRGHCWAAEAAALTLRLGSAGHICNYISPRTVAVALFAISHHPQRFKQTVPAQLAHVHASGDEE